MSNLEAKSPKTKSKVDRIKETDKGEHANKETAFVGLEINVKPFRKWMKEHFERQNKNVGVINAHYLLATVDQILFYSMLNLVSDQFKKDKTGMYDITLDSLKNSIKLNQSFNNTFSFYIDKYDDNLDYQKQLCIDKKCLNEYINKYTCHDNFRVNLNKDSQNFLSYLVVQANVMLSNTALTIAECYKKSRVNSNAMIHAIKIHFSGKLYEDIMKKVDCVNTLLLNKSKKDSEKNDKQDDEHPNGETKKTDNSGAEQDSDAESEVESEAEESESEVESEPELEPEPDKKTKKVNKPKNHK